MALPAHAIGVPGRLIGVNDGAEAVSHRTITALQLSRCGQAGQRMRAVIPSFDLI
jgi:hypothetical protein